MEQLIKFLARLLVLIGVSLTVSLTASLASAQADDQAGTIERQVEAAYLYKFGSYVDWPSGEFYNVGSPLTIGVIGADVLADQLTQMSAGRTVNGHTVVVRKLQSETPGPDLNVLFVGRSHNHHLGAILAAARGRPILTVTESDEGLALGSMINFVVVDGKVRFEVSPGMASRERLLISARLLAAAYRVSPGAS